MHHSDANKQHSAHFSVKLVGSESKYHVSSDHHEDHIQAMLALATTMKQQSGVPTTLRALHLGHSGKRGGLELINPTAIGFDL